MRIQFRCHTMDVDMGSNVCLLVLKDLPCLRCNPYELNAIRVAAAATELLNGVAEAVREHETRSR